MVFTTSGGTPAVRSSVVPPMRKLWPVVRGYPKMLHIWLHLARKAAFVSARGPEGVEKASSGCSPLRLLVARWDSTHEMGSRGPDCGRSTTFSPARLVFVRGRRRVRVLRLCKERLKWALAGLEVMERL